MANCGVAFDIRASVMCFSTLPRPQSLCLALHPFMKHPEDVGRNEISTHPRPQRAAKVGRMGKAKNGGAKNERGGRLYSPPLVRVCPSVIPSLPVPT